MIKATKAQKVDFLYKNFTFRRKSRGCPCDDCFVEMDYVDECRNCKDCEYKTECR